MIYIYVEDEKEGLALMNNAVDMYLDRNKVTVDTFHGIYDLKDHIESLVLNNNDKAYYVYDDIPGNTNIQSNILEAKSSIHDLNLDKHVSLIPIVCCEYTILTANNIELFVHRNAIDLVHKLNKYIITNNITSETKDDTVFKDMYNKARKEREDRLKHVQKKYNKNYSQNDIEKTVTFEKLCKKILAEALQCELRITDKLGDCWEKDCCIRKTRVCSIGTNNKALDSIEKKQFLVDNTEYMNIINRIAKENNLSMKQHSKIDFSTFTLTKSIQAKIDQLDKLFNYNINACAANLDTYYLDGYTLAEAIDMCEKRGFSDNDIRIAIKKTQFTQ